ncbi:hypothetical protein Anapl_00608 [Anas platyrhynchos]|uniref:Uncharacterized protein n=1 Tax=Anas platyrhynchos TaxID=8839 RepID=R0LJW8_ANAPL|nr:hypothetical protein Anapl_00608 [Anas platyrhynchos]
MVIMEQRCQGCEDGDMAVPGDTTGRVKPILSASEILGGSYGSPQPPPKPGAQRLNAAFLLPAPREQLCRKDAENPCEAPRKRY